MDRDLGLERSERFEVGRLDAAKDRTKPDEDEFTRRDIGDQQGGRATTDAFEIDDGIPVIDRDHASDRRAAHVRP
jgi:hypothetical protein